MHAVGGYFAAVGLAMLRISKSSYTPTTNAYIDVGSITANVGAYAVAG